MAGAWAEDEIGRKWDRCFTDAVLKLGKTDGDVFSSLVKFNYYLIWKNFSLSIIIF